MTEAIKYDDGKEKLGLIPTHAMFSTGRALTHGAKKYHDYNYKYGSGLDWDRIYSPLLRHLFKWIGGEDIDKESGLNHLDHVGACTSMLQDLVFSGIGKDTRFTSNSLVLGREGSQTWKK